MPGGAVPYSLAERARLGRRASQLMLIVDSQTPPAPITPCPNQQRIPSMKQPIKILGLHRSDLGDQMLLLQVDRRPTDREIKQLEARLAERPVLPAADDSDDG